MTSSSLRLFSSLVSPNPTASLPKSLSDKSSLPISATPPPTVL